MFERLTGRILDAGVGKGLNFPFYPSTANVIGVDLSPAMLARAKRRRGSAAAPVELRRMNVTRLGFPDRYFDNAAATFLLYTLRHELQVPALKELGRMAKTGSLIRLLEYTRPRGEICRAITKIWEPWVYCAYAADFDRRTESHVPEAGLQLIDLRFVTYELIKIITACPPPRSN